MLTMDDFRKELCEQLRAAEVTGATQLEVNSGQLHRRVGGYPGGGHSMPVCCEAMYEICRPGDQIISQPLKKKGASLTIRYALPR